MSFCQNNKLWIALAFFLFLLVIVMNYGAKLMTGVYKKDLGNGVVIYADDYVRTGRWVFDCEYRRLISREPLSTPLAELNTAGKLTIGNMYTLSKTDEVLAKEAIRAIVRIPEWHKRIRYLYSGLDENSVLRYHTFSLLVKHAGRKWAVEIDQSIGYDNKSSFKVTATRYDPEIYMDHSRLLQAAAESCPVPQ
ncbi:hypothetical protein ACCD10_09095 [Pseudomonas sp. Pseusp122]|uniref:hypothetical protein n=1 Tax=unclassified Pseudomonas TaxID=196821 RepID=UPI0039A66396